MASSLNLENCLSIPDDFEGYNKKNFNIPKHYEDCVGNVLIPAGLVQVSFFMFTKLTFSEKFSQNAVKIQSKFSQNLVRIESKLSQNSVKMQ